MLSPLRPPKTGEERIRLEFRRRLRLFLTAKGLTAKPSALKSILPGQLKDAAI